MAETPVQKRQRTIGWSKADIKPRESIIKWRGIRTGEKVRNGEAGDDKEV